MRDFYLEEVKREDRPAISIALYDVGALLGADNPDLTDSNGVLDLQFTRIRLDPTTVESNVRVKPADGRILSRLTRLDALERQAKAILETAGLLQTTQEPKNSETYLAYKATRSAHQDVWVRTTLASFKTAPQ